MPDFFQIMKLYTAAAVVIPPSPTRFFLPPARNYTRMQACPAGFNPGNTRDRWVSFGPQSVATFHGFSYFSVAGYATLLLLQIKVLISPDKEISGGLSTPRSMYELRLAQHYSNRPRSLIALPSRMMVGAVKSRALFLPSSPQ